MMALLGEDIKTFAGDPCQVLPGDMLVQSCPPGKPPAGWTLMVESRTQCFRFATKACHSSELDGPCVVLRAARNEP